MSDEPIRYKASTEPWEKPMSDIVKRNLEGCFRTIAALDDFKRDISRHTERRFGALERLLREDNERLA